MLPAYGAEAHALLEIAAFALGAALYGRLRARRPDPLPQRNRTAVLVGAALGALLGSRLLAALEHPGSFDGLSAARALLVLYGGKTIVGGLLGGLIGVEGVKRFVGERRRSGDLFVYPLLAAIAVGRVGCLLAGVRDETVGLPSSLPWAFPQGDGVPRHPTALYEILVLGALALALYRLERRRAREGRPLREGELFGLFMAAYLLWRLAVEFIKPVEPLALGLSAIQWACVLGLVHYARLFLTRRFAPRAVVAPLP